MNFKICISCFDTHNYEYCVKGLISALSLINLTCENNFSIVIYSNKFEFCEKFQNNIDHKIQFKFYESGYHTPKFHKINNFKNMVAQNKDKKIDYFMFIDADTLVVKNIFQVIRENYHNISYDILIAQELNTKIAHSHVINYNSGLLFIRQNSTTFKILDDWLSSYIDELKRSKNPINVHDQPHLRGAIRRHNPVIGTLPKNCNYRGHEAQGFIDWLWDDIFVLHNHEMYRRRDVEKLWTDIDSVNYDQINSLTNQLTSKVTRINASIRPNSCLLVSLGANKLRRLFFSAKIILRYVL